MLRIPIIVLTVKVTGRSESIARVSFLSALDFFTPLRFVFFLLVPTLWVAYNDKFSFRSRLIPLLHILHYFAYFTCLDSPPPRKSTCVLEWNVTYSILQTGSTIGNPLKRFSSHSSTAASTRAIAHSRGKSSRLRICIRGTIRDDPNGLCAPHFRINRRCDIDQGPNFCWPWHLLIHNVSNNWSYKQEELSGDKKRKFGTGCASTVMERRVRYAPSPRQQQQQPAQGRKRRWQSSGGPITPPPLLPAESKDWVNITLPYRRSASQCIAHLAARRRPPLRQKLLWNCPIFRLDTSPFPLYKQFWFSLKTPLPKK